MSTFDSFSDENTNANKPDKTIWEIIQAKKGDKDILSWLQGEKAYLLYQNRLRFQAIERNLALYKGIQYQSQENRETRNDLGVDRAQAMTKIVANHIYDLVQNKTSRLIKYRPAVAILPTNDEFEDKVGAKMCQKLIDNVWYNEKFDGVLQNEIVKLTHVMGECYMAQMWDENAGDVIEEFKSVEKQFKKDGKVELEEKDAEGNPIVVDRVLHNGDIKYKIWFTLDCLVDYKSRFDDAEYMFHKEAMSVAEAKLRWPDKNISVKAESDAKVYDYERMMMRSCRGEVIVWSFYHKSTLGCPKGLFIQFTGDTILHQGDLPYSHGLLPVNRLTDIDLPGELHGMSFLQLIKGLTGTYNNLTNIALRNLIFVSHPKWVFPVGSVKREALGNDITLVEYKGATPPVLAQQNPTPPELYQFRDSLKEEFQQIAGIGNVTRGEPPPGIKAGIALQFLAEQENERFNEAVLKYNEWIRSIPEMTLALCGDNYSEDEKRMIRVIGRNNKWMTSFFDIKYLKRRYDIRIMNTSALPQSKAARTQYVLDLHQMFPDRITADQVLDILDLSQSDKFTDIATVSVRAAEAENESMMEGVATINDPQEFEDHIAHWTIHVKQIREWGFKNETPKEVQQVLIDHVTAHEMLMYDNGMRNPVYAQKLMNMEGYPLFFIPPAAPPMPAPEQGVPQMPPPEAQAALNEYMPENLPTNIPGPSLNAQMSAGEQVQTQPNIQPTQGI